MILKIHDVDNDRWIFFDGISEFRTCKGYLRRGMSVEGQHDVDIFKKKEPEGCAEIPLIATCSYIPTSDYEKVSASKGESFPITFAFLSLRNGSCQTIAFGSSGFLLNDEGKTIERL